MAGIALSVVGLIQGAIFGIIPLLSSSITPDITSNIDSKVRIGVALSGTETGGDAPYIAAFNELKEFVGYYDGGGKIERGGFSDFNINQHCSKGCQGGQQAAYLQLFAGDDAICVAYIAQTWADGTKRGWLGDMGKICNMPWYYSNISVSTTNGGSHSVSGHYA